MTTKTKKEKYIVPTETPQQRYDKKRKAVLATLLLPEGKADEYIAMIAELQERWKLKHKREVVLKCIRDSFHR